METVNGINYLLEYSGGADKESAVMRNSICNSADAVINNRRCFYISANGNDNNDGRSISNAWKTTEAIVKHYEEMSFGDAILFERGGVYRQKNRLSVKSGLFFGAYGYGEKPKIYGSERDYANPKLWNKSEVPNIWILTLDTMDVGLIIFNFEKAVGIKKFAIDELGENGDFYYNIEERQLFLYCDAGNPGSVFDNIEISVFGNIFFIEANAEDIVFDNLCIKYGGSHGIGSNVNVKNVSIKNCEFSFIGGSLQNYLNSPRLRYGNAVQFWSSAENCVVENNWVHQVYDAGITFQGGCDKNDNPSIYKDISFSNNLIEYCTYSIEFFDRVDHKSVLSNIRFDNNIMRFAGYGWGNQRPDPKATSHITGWSHGYDNLVNFSIKNNIFDCSTYALVHWNWQNGKEHKSLEIFDNAFYQTHNCFDYAISFGQFKIITASNQKELEQAVEIFDKTPQLIKWID